MRFLAIILFSLIPLTGCSQYFLRDAQGRIIVTESGGILAIIDADTASSQLVLPPDTIQFFDITMVNPGDASTPGLASGVQAYWSFEETSGSTAYDSAASYDGTLTNTPTQSQTGISNYCYLFAAASEEWIDLGTSFWDVDTDDLTVSFWWYNIYAAGGLGGIIGNQGTVPHWSIRAYSGQVVAVVWMPGPTEYKIISNSSITDNAWHHGVLRLDRDGYMTLHIDNVLQTDQEDISSESAVSLSNSNTMAIGRSGNHYANYYHNGYIDEIKVANRLFSISEVSELYGNGSGKFWPFGVTGGDTLNMINSSYDARADTFRHNYKYASYPTSRTDGILGFAYGIADTADYNDTTFLWSGLKDTTAYWAAWSGLTVGDVWTAVPNKDTVFIDSSNITPPIQDPSGWDTVYYEDFEQHTGAPLEYTTSLWYTDWAVTIPAGWRDSDHRWPGWWSGKLQDSIVIDPITSSKAIKFSFEDTIADGYGGNTVRGGDLWRTAIDGDPKEVYYSFNVQFRPDFDFNMGGKLGPSVTGGSPQVGDPVERPGYGEGFENLTMWHHDPEGGIIFYFYHQNGPSRYGDVEYWNEFAPTGDGLQYDGNGMFIFDVTSPTWYNITIRYVCNSFTGGVPNQDGIFEGYVNGYLIERLSGLYLLTVPDINKGIASADVTVFFGGAETFHYPQRDEWILMDDFIMFTYDESVNVVRGNELSPPGRVLNLPNFPKVE